MLVQYAKEYRQKFISLFFSFFSFKKIKQNDKIVMGSCFHLYKMQNRINLISISRKYSFLYKLGYFTFSLSTSIRINSAIVCAAIGEEGNFRALKICLSIPINTLYNKLTSQLIGSVFPTLFYMYTEFDSPFFLRQ